MLTAPVPATTPANATTPGPAASTCSPGVPARSTPRCPGSHGWGGARNALVITGLPASGQRYRGAVGGAGVVGAAGARGRAGTVRAGCRSTAGPAHACVRVSAFSSRTTPKITIAKR